MLGAQNTVPLPQIVVVEAGLEPSSVQRVLGRHPLQANALENALVVFRVAAERQPCLLHAQRLGRRCHLRVSARHLTAVPGALGLGLRARTEQVSVSLR